MKREIPPRQWVVETGSRRRLFRESVRLERRFYGTDRLRVRRLGLTTSPKSFRGLLHRDRKVYNRVGPLTPFLTFTRKIFGTSKRPEGGIRVPDQIVVRARVLAGVYWCRRSLTTRSVHLFNGVPRVSGGMTRFYVDLHLSLKDLYHGRIWTVYYRGRSGRCRMCPPPPPRSFHLRSEWSGRVLRDVGGPRGLVHHPVPDPEKDHLRRRL